MNRSSPKITVLSVFALLSGTLSLTAGSYGPQVFDYSNGTTDLGDGTTIGSNTRVASVQGGALQLTQSGVGGTQASFKLPDLDPGQEIDELTVTFDLRMSTSGNPADGVSVNFGAIPPGDGGGENGFALEKGFFVAWDTYNNGNDAPSVEVVVDGVSVANVTQNFASVDNVWTPVTIRWDASGLDVVYNGTSLVTNLVLNGFVPAPGDRLAFSGRTGGATQDTFIDNLSVVTVPEAPLVTGGLIISEFLADNTRWEDEDCDRPDWIELYNGQGVAIDLAGHTLTDDPLMPFMWTLPSITLPPYGYLIVFASGKDRIERGGTLHTNFSLERNGGYLALLDPSGTPLTEYPYGDQEEDISYGELGSGRILGYFESPTPGSKNAGLHAAGPPAEAPQFDRAGGVFSTAATLAILPPASPTAVVRYTLDGTVPVETSPAYQDAFVFFNTSTVRARVFEPGRLPGEVKSRTLIELANDVQNFNSALPIVVADSAGVNIDQASNPSAPRPYRNVYTVVIDRDPNDGDLARMTAVPDFTGRGGMHVRGQSSSGFPKKQYAWETWNNEGEDRDVSFLGLPEDSDWVLHAPYSDKTLMRNVLVYECARELVGEGGGMRTRFVELFFNMDGDDVSMDDYRGVYVLMEKIKRGNERVDVERLCAGVTDPALITGGYIFKKDKAPYSQPWTTATEGIPLDTHVPSELNTAQFDYLRGYVNDFEAALHGANFNDPLSGYAGYIDVSSFIDNHLFVESFKEIDGYRISQYFSKDRGEKIRALPIWDYNLSLGNANYLEGQNPTGWYYPLLSGSNYYWYDRLFQDVEFKLAYWDRFWKWRRGPFSDAELLAKIDRLDAELDAVNASGESAVTRNFDRWDILGSYVWPNADGYASRATHQAEIDWMKNWLTARLAWIETQSQGTTGNALPPVFNQYGGNVSSGFALTLSDPNAWPGATLYYTTDGQDPRLPSDTITLLADSASCEALVPSVANGGAALTRDQWTRVTAPPNNAQWRAGSQGVGYERSGANTYGALIDLDVSEMYDQNESVYIRIPFQVVDPSVIAQLQLNLKYDDSFVAYVNGVEVARDSARTPASLTWNSGATDTHDDSDALTYVAFDISAHRGLLQTGNNMLAIHGLNRNTTSSDALWIANLIGTVGSGTEVSPSAMVYSNPLVLSGGVEVKARVFDGTNNWSPLTSALFAVDGAPASASNLSISEVHYRPAAPSAEEIAAGFPTRGDFEYIELLNLSASDHVSLVGVQFTDGVTFEFTGDLGAEALVLPPGGRLVIVDDVLAFQFRYGTSGAVVAGAYSGSLSNDGERITLLAADGAVIQDFVYNDADPWPASADGEGYSLVVISPAASTDLSTPLSWRSSVAIGGSPGGDDTVPFVGDPDVDEDGDGESAFLEYAQGSSDQDGSSVVQVSGRLETIDTEEYVVIEFHRNLAATALTFSVEAALDVVNWVDVSDDFILESTRNNGDGTATVRFRSVLPFAEDGNRGIYRLRIRG